MSPNPFPWRQAVAVAVLALLALALLVPAAVAATPAALPAIDLMEIVHDRARLIQFSIIAVALGIALLWWGQK